MAHGLFCKKGQAAPCSRTSTASFTYSKKSHMDTEQLKVQHDSKRGRFFIPLKGHKDAELQYEHKKQGGQSVLDFQSTFVPVPVRNQGVASKMVEQAFRFAEDKGSQVIPTCPFVDALMKEKQEFEHLRV